MLEEFYCKDFPNFIISSTEKVIASLPLVRICFQTSTALPKSSIFDVNQGSE